MLLILFFLNVNQNTQMKESILILTLFLGSPLDFVTENAKTSSDLVDVNGTW